MNAINVVTVGLVAILLLAPAFGTFVDDSVIKIHSGTDVQAKREELVRHVWGTGWSNVLTRQPTSTHDNYKPVSNDALPAASTFQNLDRIEQIIVTMNEAAAAGGQISHTSTAYLFHPRAPRGRVVIVHHGHGCALDGSHDQYNLDKTIRALLAANYVVVGMRMPLFQRPSECGHEATSQSHDDMFTSAQRLQIGSPLLFFLEPVAPVLNYFFDVVSDGQQPYCRRSPVGSAAIPEHLPFGPIEMGA